MINRSSADSFRLPATRSVTRTEGLSAARPWLYIPFRYREEDLQEDSADFYQ